MQLDRNAQPLQKTAGVGLGLPAVQLGELDLQLGGQHTVLVAEILLGVERVLLLHNIVQAAVAHDDRVEQGIVVKGELILLQNGHAQPRLDGDLAAG